MTLSHCLSCSLWCNQLLSSASYSYNRSHIKTKCMRFFFCSSSTSADFLISKPALMFCFLMSPFLFLMSCEALWVVSCRNNEHNPNNQPVYISYNLRVIHEPRRLLQSLFLLLVFTKSCLPNIFDVSTPDSTEASQNVVSSDKPVNSFTCRATERI